MNIFFLTLGCKVNQYETQGLRERFEQDAYRVVSAPDSADIIVINSCTVTAESDRKTRQAVRRCRRLSPKAVLVLTGCMAQVNPDILENLPEVDLLVGNNRLLQLPEFVRIFQQNGKRKVYISPHSTGEAYQTLPISDFSERTRAYMKIEDGCDRYCSYCMIPFARGHVRSRSLNEIESEANRLSKAGYSEIVLVGINLSAYGYGEDFNLCDAVERVCSVNGICRVRLGSLEPDHITDEMLNRFRAQDKFCPQFHLSLQSGCDATLKRMNRHYDSIFYENLVERIRKFFPDASITTDIMVGFVGETEEEYQESLSFVKKIGFAKSHVFIYSKRKGTVAAGLPNQVNPIDAERRSREMIAACEDAELNFSKKQCGNICPVLFETSENGFYEGFTPNYTRVRVPSDKPLHGQILPVIIQSIQDGCCYGILTD